MDATYAELLEQASKAPATTDTQVRITQAALALFAEHGYDGTTTAGIAARAGVTEKTLFKHFGSKRRLFAQVIYPALIEMLRPITFDNLQKVLDTHPTDFPELLENIILDRISCVRNHPTTFKLILQELTLRGEFREPFMACWRQQILPPLLKILRSARKRGELGKIPDEAVIRSVISATVGYIFQSVILFPEEQQNDRAEARRIVSILLFGLAPQKPAKAD
jgi:AcrR family transcriptional regulator